MNLPTLKPCPFCGSPGDHIESVEVTRRGTAIARIICLGGSKVCTAEVVGTGSFEEAAREDAARVWNHRTPAPVVMGVDFGSEPPAVTVLQADPQPAPVARGPEVFPQVFKLLDKYERFSGTSVAALRRGIEERIAFGVEKYGITLHRDDGREPVKDAKDEVFDVLGYVVRLMMLGELEEVRRIKMLLSQVVTIIDLCLSKSDWLESIGGKVGVAS